MGKTTEFHFWIFINLLIYYYFLSLVRPWIFFWSNKLIVLERTRSPTEPNTKKRPPTQIDHGLKWHQVWGSAHFFFFDTKSQRGSAHFKKDNTDFCSVLFPGVVRGVAATSDSASAEDMIQLCIMIKIKIFRNYILMHKKQNRVDMSWFG